LILIGFFLFTDHSNVTGQTKANSLEDGINILSNLIAKNHFKSNKPFVLDEVDSIYSTALKMYDGDISEALLALTFATLPFNRMPLTIPFIDIKLSLRLPSVKENIFLEKRKFLPGIVFFDSNINGGQDKDKIAHFFGNAFLAYNISSVNFSKFLGLFVEMFEATFNVSNKVDYRDLQSNHLGEFFGNSLQNNPDVKPSDFLNIYSLFYFSYN